ncbi:MAG: cell division protein FtsZ [Alphaproteobacteria bacterium]|nr:cell division protein FtsZ [Alphaproteobacteria bacterium]
MSIDLSVPIHENDLLTPRITVVGVGGAGGNAVNNMIESMLAGVDFLVANTDAQALAFSKADKRIQLGLSTTQGLGAGARPEVGRSAAEESIEDIMVELEGSHMVFITAGMGGGTGTGAAPVIARAARDSGMLTVGVVTKPFHFEGRHRMALADGGIEELSQYVDTLIVIPNQNLFRIADEKTTFADAFKLADNVLHSGVRSVTDLIMMPGLINLDFADVRAVMENMGKAMMGTGEAEGDNRAVDAAERAISNPLLDDTSMAGAKAVLINIAGGLDLGLFEVDEAAERIRSEVDSDANIIIGSCFSSELEGKMRVSVVATGIQGDAIGGGKQAVQKKEPEPVKSFAPSTVSSRTAVSARDVRTTEVASSRNNESVANNNTIRSDNTVRESVVTTTSIPKSSRPSSSSSSSVAVEERKVQVTKSSEVGNVRTLGQKVVGGSLPSASGLSMPPASTMFSGVKKEEKTAEPVNRSFNKAAASASIAPVKENVPSNSRSTDSFIPDAPVEVDFSKLDKTGTEDNSSFYGSKVERSSFRVDSRERISGDKHSVVVPDNVVERGRSLFELVTGRPRSAGKTSVDSGRSRSDAASPSLSVSENDRIGASQADEIMDIPAFLRK